MGLVVINGFHVMVVGGAEAVDVDSGRAVFILDFGAVSVAKRLGLGRFQVFRFRGRGGGHYH